MLLSHTRFCFTPHAQYETHPLNKFVRYICPCQYSVSINHCPIVKTGLSRCLSG